MKPHHQKPDAEAPTGDAFPNPAVHLNKPRRRPHCRRGGPRGRCSDLPRESPIEVQRNEETKRHPVASPKRLKFSSHHFLPRPPHIHPRRQQHHLHKKMMFLSLLEEQKRAMEELEQTNKNQEEVPQSHGQPENLAIPNSSVIKVPQQWHIDDTDEALILSIDVAGFKLEDLELKVDRGLLSLQGQRTNSLGDVFELLRTKKLDPILYNEAGIEARCDNQDDCIMRITIPKKEYAATNGGTIPIQVAHECPNEAILQDPSTRTTTATLLENCEKEHIETIETSGFLEDNIFIPEAEIVFERDEEEEAVGPVETVQDSSNDSLESPQESHSVVENALLTDERVEHDSDSTHSWEDLVLDEEWE